jgi:uncharacterized protein YkwD
VLRLTASLVGASLGCASIAASVAASPVRVPQSVPTEVRALADRINRHRVAIGCRSLQWSDRLAGVARRHSMDMARRGFFSHTSPDGRDPFDRLAAAGIRFQAAAENIAEGRASGRDTYDDWIGSPGHRQNIEHCGYTHFGIGLYRRRWTLELVTNRH